MFRFTLLLLLILTLPSCSWLTGSAPEKSQSKRRDFNSEEGMEQDASVSKVPIEELPQEKASEGAPSSTLDKVEVLWKMPEEPVEGFIMHYGFAPDALTYNLRLKIEDIEEYQDPQYGPVYRYVIADIPQDKSVFISLQTLNQGVASDPSEVFEVAP